MIIYEYTTIYKIAKEQSRLRIINYDYVYRIITTR